ncbi:hypothetical protein BGZ49_007542 [Haplosporangium sp. Z 27]|nr:hypothetical protein BGZ49_007542 [Haplosporangium sp. Z 27]
MRDWLTSVGGMRYTQEHRPLRLQYHPNFRKRGSDQCNNVKQGQVTKAAGDSDDHHIESRQRTSQRHCNVSEDLPNLRDQTDLPRISPSRLLGENDVDAQENLSDNENAVPRTLSRKPSTFGATSKLVEDTWANLSDNEDMMPMTPPRQSSSPDSTLEAIALPASKMFGVLHQKKEWVNNINIGDYFSRLKGTFEQPFDLSNDNIMDMTSASAFIMSMDDHAYTTAMEDLPEFDIAFPELEELNMILDVESCFEDLKNKIYNLPLNTPVRRYLYGVIESYAIFFDEHTTVPSLEEKQGVFDVVCPFVRGAFRVFGIATRISEIAVIATGERRNHYQKHEERLQLCKRADIVAVDKENLQIFVAECATLQETDVRKRMEDRWKLARCMKDIWDSGMRQTIQLHTPHERFATFGLQSFGAELHFLQLDFRGVYRLWELETCHVPLEVSGFWKKVKTCCQVSLCFAKAMAVEVEFRQRQDRMSLRQRMSMVRAANQIPRTTCSPPKPKQRAKKP